MRTINQDIDYFHSNYSIERIFNMPQPSKILIAIILSLMFVFSGLGLWFGENDMKVTSIILMISSICSMFTGICIVVYKENRYLKHKNKPYSKWMIFSSKTPKLIEQRTHFIMNKLSNESDELIQNKIELSIKQLEVTRHQIWDKIEKTISYLGKPYMGILFGVLVLILKEDVSTEGLGHFLLNTTYLVVTICFLILIYHSIKFVIRAKTKSRTKKIEDYIFVLENVLLLRKQQRIIKTIG